MIILNPVTAVAVTPELNSSISYERMGHYDIAPSLTTKGYIGIVSEAKLES